MKLICLLCLQLFVCINIVIEPVSVVLGPAPSEELNYSHWVTSEGQELERQGYHVAISKPEGFW